MIFIKNIVKEIEIIGIFERYNDIEFDNFIDDFIKCVEENKWYTGGGYKYNTGSIDFSMCVVVPFNISKNDVENVFIKLLKKYNYNFSGNFNVCT